MRLETQTHVRIVRGSVWAWVLTEARGYRTYMQSACQFGSLGPGSSGPRSPGPLNIVPLLDQPVCSMLVYYSQA